MINKKQQARLENWSIRDAHGTIQVIGNVYGHPRFLDGDFIHTSAVVNFNKHLRIVETLNTLYILGEPLDQDS